MKSLAVGQALFFIQIFLRIQAFINDAVDFDRTVFRAVVQADALFAVIAYFCRIQITEIAFPALNALAIVQHTAYPFHILIPHPLSDSVHYTTLKYRIQARYENICLILLDFCIRDVL